MLEINNLEMIKGASYSGDDDWMHYLGDEDAYFFLHENKVVAEAVLFIKDEYIRVYDIQVEWTNQYNGIGRLAIRKIMDYAILKNKKGLCGESTSEALEFWGRLGAEFAEDDYCNESSWEDDDEYEEEMLTDFTLRISAFENYFLEKC